MLKGVKDSTRGTFEGETLSSYTLNYKTAVSYAGIGCCVIRLNVKIGTKLILMDSISIYNEEELLLPFDTKYYIDYPRQTITYYKTSEICPDPSKGKKMTVSDLSIIIKNGSSSSKKINY